MQNKQTKQKVWHLMDDDSAQYVCYLDDVAGTTGLLYELIQVTKMPNGFGISRDVIDVSAYTEEAILDVMASYGYESLDMFVEQYSPVEIAKKEDGSLDKDDPGYIIDYSLIAEMLFEMEAHECLLDNMWFKTFKKAEQRVRELVSKDGIIE